MPQRYVCANLDQKFRVNTAQTKHILEMCLYSPKSLVMGAVEGPSSGPKIGCWHQPPGDIHFRS